MPRLRYDPDRDYYAVLNVPDSANQEQIQHAFRHLAKACHPDRNPDRAEWAKATFQAVSEAYSVLGNIDSRRDYDRLRWPHLRSGGARPAASADWAARARAAYTSEEPAYDATWTYADWARRTPPPPPSPEFSVGSPLISLRTLLRGPYGSIYVVVLLVLLFMPVSYLAAMRFSGFTRDAVLAQALEILPDPVCTDGAVMIDDPADGVTVQPQFTVSGTAADPDLSVFVVEWAYLGYDPNTAREDIEWQRAGEAVESSVQDGPLAEVSLTGRSGIYAVRLSVVRGDGTPLPPCERTVGFGGSGR